MGQIYVLKLRNKKWYVGYTERKRVDRILEHIENKGARWTKKHPPLVDGYLHNFSTPGKTREDEDKRTLSMMKKYGISNVRGGRWCMVDMKPYTVREIEGLIGKKKPSPKAKPGGKTRRKTNAKTRKEPKISDKEMANFVKAYKQVVSKKSPPKDPGLHDEGRLTEEQEFALEDWHSFGAPFDKELFADKSEQWKTKWLNRR